MTQSHHLNCSLQLIEILCYLPTRKMSQPRYIYFYIFYGILNERRIKLNCKHLKYFIVSTWGRQNLEIKSLEPWFFMMEPKPIKYSAVGSQSGAVHLESFTNSFYSCSEKLPSQQILQHVVRHSEKSCFVNCKIRAILNHDLPFYHR